MSYFPHEEELMKLQLLSATSFNLKLNEVDFYYGPLLVGFIYPPRPQTQDITEPLWLSRKFCCCSLQLFPCALIYLFPVYILSTDNKPQKKSFGKTETRVLLTSVFIHAPGLGPDFKRIWFFLPRTVSLFWSRGFCSWVLREHLRVVAWRCCVQASVAGNTVLRTILAVFSFQWLLKASERG